MHEREQSRQKGLVPVYGWLTKRYNAPLFLSTGQNTQSISKLQGYIKKLIKKNWVTRSCQLNLFTDDWQRYHCNYKFIFKTDTAFMVISCKKKNCVPRFCCVPAWQNYVNAQACLIWFYSQQKGTITGLQLITISFMSKLSKYHIKQQSLFNHHILRIYIKW